MTDKRRINVAISRQQYGLIIVGNYFMFKRKVPYWSRVIAYLQEIKCIVGNQSEAWIQLDRQHVEQHEFKMVVQQGIFN